MKLRPNLRRLTQMMLKPSLTGQVVMGQVLLMPRLSLRGQHQMMHRHSSKQQILLGLSHRAQGQLLEESKYSMRGYSLVMFPMQGSCNIALNSAATRGSVGSSTVPSLALSLPLNMPSHARGDILSVQKPLAVL